MARIPIPGVPQEAGQSGLFIAPPVEPQRSLTGPGMMVLGQGLQAAGFEGSRVADFLQDQHDDAKGVENDNRAGDVIRKWLYDPEVGYLHKKGGAAGKEAREQAFRHIEEELGKIEQGLENSVQLEHWRRQTGDRMERATLAADQHQAQSVFEHKWASVSARADAARVDGDLPLLKGAVAELSAMAGDSDELAASRMLAKTTEFHAQEFGRLIEQNPEKAAAYLQQHKTEIDPKVQNAMQAKLNDADAKQRGSTLGLQIIAESEKQGGTDLEQEQFAIDTLHWTERGHKHPIGVLDQARARVRQYYDQKGQLRQQAQKELVDRIENDFGKDVLLSYGSLPQEDKDRIDELGVLSEVMRAEARVFGARAAKAENLEHVEFARDLKTIEAAKYFVEALKDPKGVEHLPEGKAPGQRQFVFAQRAQVAAEYLKVIMELEAKPRDTTELLGTGERRRAREAQMAKALEKLINDLNAEAHKPGGR